MLCMQSSVVAVAFNQLHLVEHIVHPRACHDPDGYATPSMAKLWYYDSVKHTQIYVAGACMKKACSDGLVP